MREKVDVIVAESEGHAARIVADLLAETLKANPKARLGTATGGTMLPIYREMASRCAEREMSLAKVETFQLDEYIIDPWHPQSYRVFMRKHLVDVTDLPPTNMHVLNGATRDHKETCARWDQWLREAPIDFQLLGIGVEGHVAFVEARKEGGKALRNFGTTLVELSESTLRENRRFFGPEEEQPRCALSVGIGTLLKVVRHFVLAAFGPKKSAAIAAALLDDVGDRCPASYIREASGRSTVILDPAAAATLLARLRKQGEMPKYLNVRCL